jgi:hypothetical protein
VGRRLSYVGEMTSSRRVARAVIGVIAAAAVVAAGACIHVTDATLPVGAQALEPPEVYARWWALTSECAATTGDLSAVQWYVVPNARTLPVNGRDVAGYWAEAGNQIVLTAPIVLDGGAVRHEMLHALIRTGGHPRDQFVVKCAGVVECPAQCIVDGGAAPAPDPSAVPVSPDVMEVSVAPGPVALAHTGDGDVFSVTVTVHNPLAQPVVVLMPLTAGSPLAEGFLYELSGPSGAATGGVALGDVSRWSFAASESKRQLFDFASRTRFGTDRFAPGVYELRGAYGGTWSPVTPYVIAP